MRVKELKEKLSIYPDDMSIFLVMATKHLDGSTESTASYRIDSVFAASSVYIQAIDREMITINSLYKLSVNNEVKA